LFDEEVSDDFGTSYCIVLILPGWRLLFLTSWGRFQRRFDNILEDLDRHGDLIDRVANARNISEARQLRLDLRSWKEESLEQVKQDEEYNTTKQYRSLLSYLRIDETEQLSIFESVSEEVSKFPGTCAWILKNERISSWLQRKPGNNLLWLQGNPGSGKSVLSTQLVNFLRVSSSFVMTHSCSQTFASSTKYEAILKSLLHQLLRRSGELVAYAYQEFVVGKRPPTTSNFEQLLETLLDALSEAGQAECVWVIVDSVEECETARQARLITLLSQIAKPGVHGSTICKVLVTSRARPTKFKRTWQKHLLSLSDEKQQLTKAIKLYASQRLRLLHERFQQLELDGDDVETIEHMVAQKAAGGLSLIRVFNILR
jgi:archaellum biogenesis ATPase FlaH